MTCTLKFLNLLMTKYTEILKFADDLNVEILKFAND
jgi:hypothetical protein